MSDGTNVLTFFSPEILSGKKRRFGASGPCLRRFASKLPEILRVHADVANCGHSRLCRNVREFFFEVSKKISLAKLRAGFCASHMLRAETSENSVGSLVRNFSSFGRFSETSEGIPESSGRSNEATDDFSDVSEFPAHGQRKFFRNIGGPAANFSFFLPEPWFSQREACEAPQHPYTQAATRAGACRQRATRSREARMMCAASDYTVGISRSQPCIQKNPPGVPGIF